jgi:FAD/FMN-containing dehydrogenase
MAALNPVGQFVNDIHSQLNPTWVSEVLVPRSVHEVRAAIERLRQRGQAMAVSGGRHAMGSQQFAAQATLLDTRRLDGVLDFNSDTGLIEVEAGMKWPELVNFLMAAQRGSAMPWAIAQKQTGADRFTLGGSLSANIHGRGLAMRPIIADVESFTLIDAQAVCKRCSRTENAQLFALAIGGYGLFGVIASVTLRLTRRRKTERVVELLDIEQLMAAFEQRIAAGFSYGDFQFAIDETSPDFMRMGVFACYRPIDDDRVIAASQHSLAPDDWQHLVTLAHTDKSAAFKQYSEFYLSTTGQHYWSDTQQLSVYLDDYHTTLDTVLGHHGREVITEIYVPRVRLVDFMCAARDEFRNSQANLIYGTVRLIERDDESFLPWAKDNYACIIFNLHTPHSAQGQQLGATVFRRLIDMAIARGGSYYLTYHKFATKLQVMACYPQFREFLAWKKFYDPDECFQSDWYRHYRRLFAGELPK